MKPAYLLTTLALALSGCVTAQPQWNVATDSSESEYAPYLKAGTATLTGQAFLAQRGGGVIKAAGRNVTLDPATSIGNEWWGKAGKVWVHRALVPPSVAFATARRTTVADADGKFKFSNIPPGRYYVRTEVTWEVGYEAQGGLVGQLVEVQDAQAKEVILNQYPQ
jgi:hypothetical protein